MAFLSIPDVDGRTSTQIASYFSLVTSTGSLILGMLLARRYIYQGPEAADQAVSTTEYFII